MSTESEKYWLNYRTDGMKKFEKTFESIKSHERTFWISLMTLQATLLGISITLTQYLNVSQNIFVKITWVLLICSISLGIIVYKCSLESEASAAIRNLQFNMDMTDFNLKDEQGEFKNEEEKMGLFVASLLKMDTAEGDKTFTSYAKELAKKYKSQLPSEKYFKDIKYSKPITFYKETKKYLNKHINILMTFFYLSTFGAFLSLLISIFIKRN